MNKLIGFLPSVTKYPCNPKPCNNFAFVSGPAFEIATKVSFPIAEMIYLNFFISISDNYYYLVISKSNIALLCLISASFSLINYSTSASDSILSAYAFKVACLTYASASINKDSVSALELAKASPNNALN